MKIKSLTCPQCGAPAPPDFDPNSRFECPSCGSLLVAEGLPAETGPIVCPECSTVNPAEERHCAKCGAALQIDCILCHTANPVGATHCAHCGAHLERARTRRAKLARTRSRQRREQTQRLEAKIARQKQERLERLLADLDEPENHEFALYQLNQMGVEAIEALTETLLEDEDVDARYGSARALGQICQEHQIKGLMKARAARALVKALEDPEPTVRYWAVDALGKCRGRVIIDPLAERLTDEHAGVREHAREVLSQIGGKRAAQILAEADKGGGAARFLSWLKKR